MANLDNGYTMIDDFLNQDQISAITHDLDLSETKEMSGNIRNAEKKIPAIQQLVHSELLMNRARQYLDGKPSLVRAVLFDKTAGNNWLVTWHQDRTIAVSKKFDHPSWGPWSIKEGVHHVQPPVAVLNQMITFRIHLDNTDENNGCLKIFPNSHSLGILDQSAIRHYAQTHQPILCTAKAGTLLVMRPHILHSSSKAKEISKRRILHLEYSSFTLPAKIT